MINRSQNNSSGTVGQTKRTQYIAQWAIISHEMFSVSNVYRQVTGVKGHYYELSTNHEFCSAEVESSEQKVTDIIHLINGYENPFSHQCNENVA